MPRRIRSSQAFPRYSQQHASQVPTSLARAKSCTTVMAVSLRRQPSSQASHDVLRRASRQRARKLTRNAPLADAARRSARMAREKRRERSPRSRNAQHLSEKAPIRSKRKRRHRRGSKRQFARATALARGSAPQGSRARTQQRRRMPRRQMLLRAQRRTTIAVLGNGAHRRRMLRSRCRTQDACTRIGPFIPIFIN